MFWYKLNVFSQTFLSFVRKKVGHLKAIVHTPKRASHAINSCKFLVHGLRPNANKMIINL